MLAESKTWDVQNDSSTIKETTRRIQSWDRNRSLHLLE